MEHQLGPAAGILFGCDATEAEPLIVDEGNRAVGSRDPDDGWDHVGKGTETSLAFLKEVAVLPELGDRAVTREQNALLAIDMGDLPSVAAVAVKPGSEVSIPVRSSSFEVSMTLGPVNLSLAGSPTGLLSTVSGREIMGINLSCAKAWIGISCPYGPDLIYYS